MEGAGNCSQAGAQQVKSDWVGKRSREFCRRELAQLWLQELRWLLWPAVITHSARNLLPDSIHTP